MDFFTEFYSIVQRFNAKRVKYAVVGGVALSFYTEPRYTKDIDILTIPSQIDKIKEILIKLGFDEASMPWTFQKTQIELIRFVKIEKEDYLPLDILVGKEDWHSDVVINAKKVKSANGHVKIISKENLIKMKAIRNSDQDRIDIKNLKKD
jgi:predicted nucleotidyltransferase